MNQIGGIVVGTVVDTSDPLRQGRVRIRFPSLPEADASWARVASAPDRSRIRFEIQDEVLIAFEHGDVGRPFVLGALWKGSDPPAVPSPALPLPTGGFLRPIVSDSAGSRHVASLFSVLLQATPWLASMACQIRMLGTLKPLIEVVQAQPAPPRRALVDLAKAAADLAPCLLLTTPAAAVPVVRGVLGLIIAALRSAIDEGAPDAVPLGFGPALQSVLDVSAPFFALAGIEPVQLGPLKDRQAVQQAIDSLQPIVDALGG